MGFIKHRTSFNNLYCEGLLSGQKLDLNCLWQTRNGYDIWLQAEKHRVRSLIDKFWHFSLPRPQLWRHYNPTDYHKAYSILLQKIIWYVRVQLKYMHTCALHFFPTVSIAGLRI